MWRSRSCTVIARAAGRVRSATAPPSSTASSPTTSSAKAGMCFDTGSVSESRPSSTSCIAATEVMGLVME